MIAVIVLGILAVLAYASYTNQIMKAQRSVAKSALLDAATRQEQYFFSNRAYASSMTALNFPATGTSTDAYFGKDGTPLSTTAGAIYRVSVDTTSCSTAPCFTLTASPVTGSSQEGDGCGKFTFTSTNKKDVSNSTGTLASACW